MCVFDLQNMLLIWMEARMECQIQTMQSVDMLVYTLYKDEWSLSLPPSIHLSLSQKPLRKLDPGTKNVRVFVYVQENRSAINLDALNNGM